MGMEHDRLEDWLAQAGETSFSPGFSRRVLARVSPRAEESSTIWAWRDFPRFAAAAAALLVALAAWNAGSADSAGSWMDRVLNLPAATLENSLAQLEDLS